jgi:hypothetical protein
MLLLVHALMACFYFAVEGILLERYTSMVSLLFDGSEIFYYFYRIGFFGDADC